MLEISNLKSISGKYFSLTMFTLHENSVALITKCTFCCLAVMLWGLAVQFELAWLCGKLFHQATSRKINSDSTNQHKPWKTFAHANMIRFGDFYLQNQHNNKIQTITICTPWSMVRGTTNTSVNINNTSKTTLIRWMHFYHPYVWEILIV